MEHTDVPTASDKPKEGGAGDGAALGEARAAGVGRLDDSQDSVSMVEILEEEQQQEEDANAVLGASDDKHCTYPQGALPRQALYACVTCATEGGGPGGVCLACSLECHDGHDLYELYTKRNFCCDCGNSKFGDNKCKLWPKKKAVNADNKYNQNFRGEYCTCHRPYPDPEVEVEDDMIQCIVCEDWFHGRHVSSQVPAGNAFEEMTCLLCVERHPFLRYYTHLQIPQSAGSVTTVTDADTKEDVDVVYTGQSCDVSITEKTGSSTAAADTGETSTSNATKIDNVKTADPSETSDSVTSMTPSEPSTEKQKVTGDTPKAEQSNSSCLLIGYKADKGVAPTNKISLFWTKGWRKALCNCPSCKESYESNGLSFITDECDTITSYEERGRHKQGSRYERGMEALSQMNRVQQVEMISGYNNLKTELKEYLKKFAENGKVVKEENIQEFFTTLASRKRQRVEIPYHCK